MGHEASRFCSFASFTRVQKFKGGPETRSNHIKGSAFRAGQAAGSNAEAAAAGDALDGCTIPAAVQDPVAPPPSRPCDMQLTPRSDDVHRSQGTLSADGKEVELFPGPRPDGEVVSSRDRPVIQDGETKKMHANGEGSTDFRRYSSRSDGSGGAGRRSQKVRHSTGPLKTDITPLLNSRGGAVGKPFPKRPMTSKLSAKVWSKLEELFRLMDQDGSNAVTRDEAAQFFQGAFSNLSVDAMFNEVDTDGSGAITSEEFIKFWVQVKSSGYKEQDILDELDELIEGGAWVDWKDGRDTVANEVRFPKRPIMCRLSAKAWKRCEELFHTISNHDEKMQITREKAQHFFKGTFANLSADAMFNEIDLNRHGVINAKDFMAFWVQVKASGYKEKDILEEIDNIIEGSPWVDWKDGRTT